MSTRKLILFASSDSPDPFVNSIVHATRSFEIDGFSVVKISDRNHEINQDTIRQASDVFHRIWEQLKSLSDGKYLDFRTVPPTCCSISDDATELYQEILSRLKGHSGHEVVSFQNLSDKLEKLANQRGLYILDVTTLKNSLLVDVSISLALQKPTKLYTFDLQRRGLGYGIERMIHNLSASDFIYRDVLDSGPIRCGLTRYGRWRTSVKFFAGLFVMLLLGSIVLAILDVDSWIFKAAAGIGSIAGLANLVYPFIFDKFDK